MSCGPVRGIDYRAPDAASTVSAGGLLKPLSRPFETRWFAPQTQTSQQTLNLNSGETLNSEALRLLTMPITPTPKPKVQNLKP